MGGSSSLSSFAKKENLSLENKEKETKEKKEKQKYPKYSVSSLKSVERIRKFKLSLTEFLTVSQMILDSDYDNGRIE
ncbi:CLUMA_CG000256, isoform A [Clunio marinus]|uniref:CLUMA_CG000256, isoform A n=1 Tax=Clunio marinus TaxID=568069 RepID=A0A1J1HGN8_9DIPT|nr:CLUMA_CG000256, isoform A [Clunio marinus]